MMRQPSESETQVAGKLAASLTPRIVAMPVVRGEQNSGMVDVRALYESSMEQALRRAEQAESAARAERAKRAAMAAQVAHAQQQAQAAVAYATSRRQARPAAYEDRTPEVYEDVDLAGEYMVIPGVVPRGRIGWFAVAVAWLATASLAAGVATMVPAHGLKRVLAPVAAAPAPAQAPIVAPVVAAPVAKADPSGIPTVSLSSLAPVAATPPPTASAIPTPTATSTSKPHPSHHALAHAEPPSAAPLAAKAAPIAKAAPAADDDAEPAPPKATKATAAAKAPAVPAPAAAAPASGGSLEDLIRQAVAKEAKQHHAAAPADP
ncbi:MAG: hypothetical protein ACRENE_23955 [Polyangiaceae bacterium]